MKTSVKATLQFHQKQWYLKYCTNFFFFWGGGGETAALLDTQQKWMQYILTKEFQIILELIQKHLYEKSEDSYLNRLVCQSSVH